MLSLTALGAWRAVTCFFEANQQQRPPCCTPHTPLPSSLFCPRSVAIKTISKLQFKTEQDHKDMLMEVELMGRVRGHPNVVEQLDWYEDRTGFFVVAELVTGACHLWVLGLLPRVGACTILATPAATHALSLPRR